jgi:hypothetical protein
MERTRFWMIVALGLVAGVVALPVPSYAQFTLPSPQPQQPQAPATDPRVAQIKTGLEKAGLKVYNVIFRRTEKGDPHWVALTAAQYAQPSFPAVQQQSLIIWGVMYPPLAGDPPVTILTALHVWNKYGIRTHATVENIATLVKDHKGAATDAERRSVFEKFFGTVTFDVLDLERNQYVDEKDFINKNFTAG